jgi:hypothetical protein
MTNRTDRRTTLTVAVLSLLAAQCGGVSNADAARRSYLGLDRAVDRALSLAFDGLNAASSANIPAQMASGDLAGTMLVEGQVSQGSSSNREMRLLVTLTGYRDNVSDTGATDAGAADAGATGPALRLIYSKPASGMPIAMDLSLRPPMFTGTFAGTLDMTGELAGTVTVNVTLSGQLESMSGSGSRLQRVAGTTRITGTVTSAYGTYPVDVTR